MKFIPKKNVIEVLEFQNGCSNRNFYDPYGRTKKILDKQPDMVDYCKFSKEIYDAIDGSNDKLGDTGENFRVRFQARLKKFKKGKDWRVE